MSEYRDEFPCTNCILLAQCMTNIPTHEKEGYEDLQSDPYLYCQYVNELFTDCQLMRDYILTGDYYETKPQRRTKAARFFEAGYKSDIPKSSL